jgi:predicted enzyme related to lactoylglutathione lyase
MVAASKVVIHAHASDIDASLAFYRKLRFEVHADEVDGRSTRYVRMTHVDASGLLLNIHHAPQQLRAAEIDPQLSPEEWPVLFSLQVESYLDWIEHLQREGLVLANYYGQPWAVWLHLRDPAGNLICITTSNLY